jgi:hypothetical protein
MKIKNFATIAAGSFLLFITVPAFAASITGEPVKTEKAAGTTAGTRPEKIMERLAEIKGTDKSELTRAERKDLRKELKALKREMARDDSNKGVYLSVGAIIIIILLLILIL